MIHLSRLASDLLFYSSKDLIDFKDNKSNFREYTLSALKRIKTEAEKVFRNQAVLSSNLKGIPMSFDSEMYELHEVIFDSTNRLNRNLKISGEVFAEIFVKKEKARKFAEKGGFQFDEIVNYLIHQGMSFGTATEKTRNIVSFANTKNKRLNELNLDELKSFSDDFKADIFEAISLEKTIKSKKQFGGTSPERVFEALKRASDSLERE